MCCSASAVLLALLAAALAGAVGLLLLLLAGALLTALLLLTRFLAGILVGILVHYVVLSNGWFEVSFAHSPAQRQ